MIKLTGTGLTIEDVVQVARFGKKVEISEESKKAINHSRSIVEKILEEEKVVYGISTGFGEFSKVFITKEKTSLLQKNLILSHCVGVGEFFSKEHVRAMILLRCNSLVKGYSGIRLQTVEKLIELLNKDVTPAVPVKGSVGASGDLAPLSHIASVVFGEGLVLDENGKGIKAKDVLKEKKIEPNPLTAKEGLALINGTQVMTGVAAITAYDTVNLFKIADIALSVSLEALDGLKDAFDERIAMIRPHGGQKQSVENINKITKNSYIEKNNTTNKRVQDAYSLRCSTQVHGASKDALRRVIDTITIEMNSVTDNPIVMPDTGEIISGGNFHGQPIALVMDYLKLAISEIGNISERRCNRMVDPHLSNDLPPFLTEQGGICSGFMIAQYTSAALASENKVLVHPASADSIPTSANQEDHVSMGTIGARQSDEILKNVEFILSIELMMGCQGLDYRKKEKYGDGTTEAFRTIRKVVPFLRDDEILAPYFNKIKEIISNGDIVKAVEEKIGKLNI